MHRILVIEKSPLIATDIIETVRQEYPLADALSVGSIDDAMAALTAPEVIDLCIVSGSATRERLARLAAILDDKRVRTVAITGEPTHHPVFGSGTIHLTQPFTSDMLLQAVRQISLGGEGSGQPSNQG